MYIVLTYLPFQIHGPFDFTSHRPEAKQQQQQQQQQHRPAPRATPELVDIADNPSPPLVDISQTDVAEEGRELLGSLVAMFPDTPVAYLEEQVEDLAGRPAATERFIGELLERGAQPPLGWTPRVVAVPAAETSAADPAPPIANGAGDNGGGGVVVLEEEPPPPPPPQPQPGPSRPLTEEEQIEAKFQMLESCFPNVDPEFLHAKVTELKLHADDNELAAFFDSAMESKCSGFPTRAEYEKRRETQALFAKYSQEVTVEDILKMYPDPVEYFSNEDRKASPIYKQLSQAYLKREFRNVAAAFITRTWEAKKHLFYPTYKALKATENSSKYKRKTKRTDLEAPLPEEQDLNFLKVRTV